MATYWLVPNLRLAPKELFTLCSTNMICMQLFEIFTEPTPQGRFAPSGALYKIILTQPMPHVTTVTLNNFESINSMQPKAALTTYADDENHTTIIM